MVMAKKLNRGIGQGMLPQQRALVHIHDDAEQKGPPMPMRRG